MVLLLLHSMLTYPYHQLFIIKFIRFSSPYEQDGSPFPCVAFSYSSNNLNLRGITFFNIIYSKLTFLIDS